MNESVRLPRSPELMSRGDSAVLVVDVQDKLVTLIPHHQRLVWNIRRLIDGAKILGVMVTGTEQYPRGLGPTTEVLATRLGEIPEKLTFSCGGCPQVFDGFREADVYKLLVVGIEAHVCIQQTVLDALADGFQVYLAVDAIGARHEIDYHTALRRMESSGAVLTTVEAALFEWCDAAGTAEFKQISALVREVEPTDA
jgi:nicotinamidase-related amidase